jgi:hypothetical protein
MKRNNLFILFITAQILFLSYCDEPEYRGPLGGNSDVPENVSELSYESRAGAVRLFYQLPDDSNVAQVAATYTLSTGKKRTVAASVYADYLLLDGFSDTLEHQIEVHTISKSNVSSENQVTTVKANEAAIWKVKRSLNFTNQFGGFNIQGINVDSAGVYIFIMGKNVFDEFEVDNFKSFATTFRNITRKIRGLDTLVYEYRYFVMDKWDNSTDTSSVFIEPLYETSIPKSGYRAYRLPGDAPQVTNGATLSMAWDGVVDSWPGASFTSQELGGDGPHMVTIDLGVEVQLSRFWYRPYPEFWWDPSTIQFFYLTTMRNFEFYGSLAPNVNGQLDSTWVYMGEFEIVKPSGSPVGADTPEDIAVAQEGFNFEFDATWPKLRYVRIRCLRNWADGTAQNINELEFFGDPR